MLTIKTQLCCLLLTLLLIAFYIITSNRKKIPCNKSFDALLIICPWAIIFDGATAWTVNNLDVVPTSVNMILHGIFFLLMNATVVLAFMYVLKLTVGIPKNPARRWILVTPGIIFAIIIIAFLPQLDYLQGKTTNYSMGISAIICYVSMAIYYMGIIALLIARQRNIERTKLGMISGFLGLSAALCACQIVWPEILITSIIPTMLVVGLYVSIEDPSIVQLQYHNEEMVTGFATLVESRDNSTGNHIRRTQAYVRVIMEEMFSLSEYRSVMTRDYINNVTKAAPMHDIGKIATPDVILQKPGKLTPEEFEIMKQHAPKGGQIIMETFCTLDEPEFQQIAYEVARFHHEKWNGKGYPDGLSGEDIPLHARIMAVADVFDAVSCKRVYRDALPLDACFEIIEKGSGTDFDPRIVQIFLNARNKVEKEYFAQ